MNSRSLILLSTILAATSPAHAEEAAPESKPISIDVAQAFVGLREYQFLNAGEDAGMIRVTSRFTEDGNYLVHDHSSSELLGVDEQMLMIFDGSTFAPIRVLIQARMGPMFMDINWEWDGDSASGNADTYNFDSGQYARHDLDRDMPAGTLTRGAAIFLANAMPLEDGKVIELNWFNAMNGQIKPITFTVEGRETVTVPAGSFDTFRVSQVGGAPGNILYVTTEQPRRIVRIDVSGTEMEMHLLPAQ